MTPGVGLEGIGILVLGQIRNFKHKIMHIDLVERVDASDPPYRWPVNQWSVAQQRYNRAGFINSLRPSDAYICVGKLTSIDSDNGLSHGRHQAIIWTNAGMLLFRPRGTNLSEILIGIQTFSFIRKCIWKCRLQNSVILSRPRWILILQFSSDTQSVECTIVQVTISMIRLAVDMKIFPEYLLICRQCSPDSLTHICGTWGRGVNCRHGWIIRIWVSNSCIWLWDICFRIWFSDICMLLVHLKKYITKTIFHLPCY